MAVAGRAAPRVLATLDATTKRTALIGAGAALRASSAAILAANAAD